MNRYQVYLNPHSVSVLDDFEKISDLSRSKLIREAIDRFADQLVKVFAKREEGVSRLTYLDKLAGSIKFNSSKPTNYALDDDEIYLQD